MLGGLLATGRVTHEIKIDLHGTNHRHAIDYLHEIEDSAIAGSKNMDVRAAVRLLEVKCVGEFLRFAVPINLCPLIACHRGVAPGAGRTGERKVSVLRLLEFGQLLLGLLRAQSAEVGERSERAPAPDLRPIAEQLLRLSEKNA